MFFRKVKEIVEKEKLKVFVEKRGRAQWKEKSLETRSSDFALRIPK